MIIKLKSLSKTNCYSLCFALAVGMISCFLSGCDLMSERLMDVGRRPDLSKVNIYETQYRQPSAPIEAIATSSYPGYAIMSNEGLYETTPTQSNAPNSIWKTGARSFFRSYSVGDIISVVISIQDQATLNNKTQKNRNASGNMGITSLFGLETAITKALPQGSSANSLLGFNSATTSAGNGQINRSEVVRTTVATSVIKVLPSGNLVIKGLQEVRVNHEIREVMVTGIVRPEDISSANTVRLDQIAEARISYGGRGHVSEYQQDQYGKQIVDIISPF